MSEGKISQLHRSVENGIHALVSNRTLVEGALENKPIRMPHKTAKW